MPTITSHHDMPPRKQNSLWLKISVPVVSGIILLSIGMFIGDRKELTIKNTQQDAAHLTLARDTAKQFSEVAVTMTAIQQSMQRFQDYPNTAGALEKRIIDDVTKKIEKVEQNMDRRFDALILDNKEQRNMMVKDNNDKYELLKTLIQQSQDRQVVRDPQL